MAETLDLVQFRVPVLSQLCMHSALTGDWRQAYLYAVQAIAIRKRFDRGLIHGIPPFAPLVVLNC